MARLDYLEMSSGDLEVTKSFYTQIFDFQFTDFGPEYCATTTGDTDIGFHLSTTPAPPMGVIQVKNLEEYYARAVKAGAKIMVEIFEFPGGKRFEMLDPSGNRIGVWETTHT